MTLQGIAPDDTVDAGSSLTINVATSDSSLVKHVRLFLNGTLVRQENMPPYTWNDASLAQSDAALQNLASGTYNLRAEMTDINDRTVVEGFSFIVRPAATDIALEDKVKAIFASNCANSSCHDATPGGARIDLVTGTLEDFAARLVGVPSGGSKCNGQLIIDPHAPTQSLFLTLTDANASDQCMAKMPFGKNGVTEEEHRHLTQWVQQLIAIAPPIDTPPQDAMQITPEALNTTTGFSVAHYAKKILTAEPITNSEYDRLISGNHFDELMYETLLQEWMATPAFEQKLRQFLRLALQQNASPLTPTVYFNQLGGLSNNLNTPVDKARALASIEEVIVRTALRIINKNDDFRKIITTRNWEVTTIALAALGRADQQAMKETSSDYKLYNLPGVIDSDYTDWRTIQLTQADAPGRYANDLTYTEFVRGLKDGDSFPLLAPRVGFFNSPAFILNWETNPSNQFRLTLNQTLISTLGLSFEAGDTTPRNHHNGLFAEHAEPNTDCYACHTQMDPMRNVFLKYYSSKNTRALATIGDENPDFSFHGLSKNIANMDQFARALADHPNFAFAWATKVCQWVTSVECDKQYPQDVQQLAEKFKTSGYQLKTLILETFKSPLVINGITDNSTMLLSIARQDHLCTHLDQGLSSIAEKHGRSKPKAFCDKTAKYREAQTNLIPNDEYTRGAIALLQPSQLDPFYVKSVEYLCSDRGSWFVGNNDQVPFHRANITAALDDITTVILGIPTNHPHYDKTRQSLEKTYDILRKSPKCNSPSEVNLNKVIAQCGYALSSQQAIETLWKMTCSAPSTISIGLGF